MARRSQSFDWRLTRLIPVVVVAAFVIWVVIGSGLGRTLQSAAPAKAVAIWPWNAAALSTLGEQAIVDNASNPAAVTTATTFARQALDLDASSALAYAVLGMAADARREPNARSLLLTSERLSRRIVLPQLWLIEDAVERGDVDAALRHFDIALRTSKEAPALLYPVLMSAAGDPNITAKLAALLRSRPLWRDDYLTELAARGDPMTAWRLVQANVGAGMPVGASATLASRLIEGGHPSEAFVIAGGWPTGETSVDLATPSRYVAPFDWNLTTTDSVDAARQSGGGIVATSNSTTVQTAVSRLAALRAGRYKMSSQVKSDGPSDQLAARWTVSCLNGQILAELPVAGRGHGERTVVIPSDCKFQWLRFEMTAQSDTDRAEADISAFRIAPIS